MSNEEILKQFLDSSGKLKQWPSKLDKRQAALEKLGGRFEPDKTYKETEVNEIIKGTISFGDHQTVRRELVSAKILGRAPDGTKYWRVMPDGSAGK